MPSHADVLLFGAESVRAILSGRKSQTRRVIRDTGLYAVDAAIHGETTSARERVALATMCPHGQPGDRLWVREAWGYRGSHWSSSAPKWKRHSIEYAADGAKREIRRADKDERGIPQQKCRCSGKGDEFDRHMEHQGELERYWKAWRRSIFMPRWASRLTLEITEVRVQRLQEITEEDAQAEGMVRDTDPCDHTRRSCADVGCLGPTYRAAFADGWEGLNGKRGYGWEKNPWCWAISFSVVR